MKIVAYNSSVRGLNSNGYKFIEKFRDMFKEKNKDCDFVIIQENEINIMDSDGNAKEFFDLSTATDDNDDIRYIEKEFLSADIVILISPVYVHNVNSNMKRLIDRLGHWTHIFKLIGKRGIIISVSDNNGNEFVNNYLNEVMQYWGVYVIAKVSLTSKIMSEMDIMNSYYDYLNRQIIFSDINNPDIPEEQEHKFKLYKNRYESLELQTAEKQYW